jgi:hypothetical protein
MSTYLIRNVCDEIEIGQVGKINIVQDNIT